ncbi:MAG: transglycosylase SLT domain-containing protein [Dechloromonas sp.]|nr:transglycosylase SLT domain-containing protein [Dechloromonas sp.]
MPFSQVQPSSRRLAGLILGLLFSTTSLSALAETDFNPRLKTAIPESLQMLSLDGFKVQEIQPQPELPLTIDLTLRTHDLWDRLRQGFAMIDLNDDLVLHYQQWYQNRPGALRQMIERSRPYLHHIVEELEARGMPTELALLPMVESSFNPMAHSPAAASGLWQFIPATGKRFNLEQNWWRDERRDVMASTSAALDYLQTIYDMHGDWHLALASYNWGEGAVKRAIEKNEARGLPTDYPNLTMPKETRHYVPKLQALKNILGNPETFARLGLPFIPNQTYLATAASPRPMDVKTAARLANMTLEEFRHLNPSHNRPVIDADTPVVLPADRVDTFNENLANHRAPLTQWQAYAVRSAERVGEIAARFGVSTSELAQVNGLPGNVRLAAGSKLLVPGNGNLDGLQRMLSMESSPAIIQPEPQPKKLSKKQKSAKPGTAKNSRTAPKKVVKATPTKKNTKK